MDQQGKDTVNKNNDRRKRMVPTLVGMARALVGFPLEQPLDSLKTQWQANPLHKNELKVLQHMRETKGIFRGLYAGSWANITRSVTKNSYRGHLMGYLPPFYAKNLPTNLPARRTIQLECAAVSIAFFESIVLSPMERTKVYFMTNPQKISYVQYFKNFGSNIIFELYKGYGPLFARQSLAWTVFFQCGSFYKDLVRKWLKIPQDQKLTFWQLLPAVIPLAMTNATVIMPFDCAKTHMEKKDPTSTYASTFKNIYNKGGVTAFYTGIRVRFVMYLITDLFNLNLLEILQHYFKRA